MKSSLSHPQLIQQSIRILKFGTVGLSGVIVNSGFLFLLTEKLKFDYRISALFAIELSILNNFILNACWTWADKRATNHKLLLIRFLKFQLSTSVVAIINYGLLITLTEFFHIHYFLSNFAGIAIGSLLNFIIGHFWVFSNKLVSASGNDI
jgi:dolichol-phosphate mannosyltransferase